jgi:hypothetical protein
MEIGGNLTPSRPICTPEMQGELMPKLERRWFEIQASIQPKSLQKNDSRPLLGQDRPASSQTPRGEPDLFRAAMFNFVDVHQGRSLSEAEVLAINRTIKLRAYRFIAAGKEEWLYPERHTRISWREVGKEAILMPDPRPLSPSSEMILGYEGGAASAMDAYGRMPGQPGYAEEVTSQDEWGSLLRWQAEFEERFGADLRGGPWDRTRKQGKGG